jgi:hypothetical protein
MISLSKSHMGSLCDMADVQLKLHFIPLSSVTISTAIAVQCLCSSTSSTSSVHPETLTLCITPKKQIEVCETRWPERLKDQAYLSNPMTREPQTAGITYHLPTIWRTTVMLKNRKSFYHLQLYEGILLKNFITISFQILSNSSIILPFDVT